MRIRWGRRTATIAVVVVVVCSGIVAAGVLFFSTSAQTDVQDPIVDNESSPLVENKTFQFSGWDGGWTNETVVTGNDNPNSTYLLKINLTKYNGQTGDAAIVDARQSENEEKDTRCTPKDTGDSYILCFWVENTTKGFDEEIRRGLLSDGSAMYYEVPKKGDGKLKFKVRSLKSGEVTISRTTKIPDEISIRTHRELDTENCENCHAVKYPPEVHQDMGATESTWTDWESGRCATCHENTMTDLHQDCDNACHDDGYPIVANLDDPDEANVSHDPNNMSRPNMIQGEYFCGSDSGCHGVSSDWGGHDEGDIALSGAIGPVHVYEYTEEETSGYCIKCHNDIDPGSNNKSITNLHQSSTDEGGCEDCHGVNFDQTHEPAWNMGMDRKSDCGSDGCHGWGGGGGGW